MPDTDVATNERDFDHPEDGLNPDMTDAEFQSRSNELTAIIGREHFEKVPGDVTGERDKRRWREFREKYHAASQDLSWHEFPVQLDFELNTHCNLQCAFCLHGQETIKKNLLGFDRYKKVIDEASEYGLVSIKMNYINEPLLLDDLPRYVDYAKRNGILNVYFATNGTMLDEEWANALIDCGVSKIMISLDAATKETYDYMRGRGRLFPKVEENIRRLVAIRDQRGLDWPKVRVNFLKTKDNIHEADRFIQKWEDTVEMIGFQDLVALPDEQTGEESIPTGDDDLPMYTNRLDSFKCSFPFKLMVVDGYGQILPCCTFSGREMPLGEVDNMSLKEAWDSKQMHQLKTLHENGNYEENSVCKHCIQGC